MTLPDEDPDWRPERVPPALAAGQVHVWRVALGAPAAERAELEALLNEEERARVARFLRPVLGERYIVARGTLRRLLGRYLDAPPARLRLGTGENGKPHLPEHPELRFNLSHSSDRALLAFARDVEVGVDVEALVERSASWPLAERFFAPEELEVLRRLPPERFLRGFFTCWTRKEAYLKGVGVGITRSLASFAVSVDPSAPPALLHDREHPANAERWRLADVHPGPGFLGSLAVRAEGFETLRFENARSFREQG